jgi:phosphate transport system substrate-binding protein
MRMRSTSSWRAPLALALGIFGAVLAIRECHAAPSTSGTLRIDGSSTVFPITEAVAEEFRAVEPGIPVTVGISGTGGGFKKFLAGEIDIVDASRPIKASELEFAQMSNISFIELPIAYDALSVVVNKKANWVDSLTVAELKKIWAPEAQGVVKKWSDIRPGFPDKPLQLYGPGTDSGTFDYFTEAVNGKEDACRADYTSSEDDNVLVTGVAGNEGALGFFGLAFYEGNKERLKVLAIDDEKPENGAGAQLPTAENVINGKYSSLARPLFIYVRTEALSRPEVAKFTAFYLEQAQQLAAEVGYVPLPSDTIAKVKSRLAAKTVGTLFDGKSSKPGMTLNTVLE